MSTPRTTWQQWLDHPEHLWWRRLAFQIHFWIGALMAAYVLFMSVSGSVIVFRNALPGAVKEWLVRLHGHLGVGAAGDLVVSSGAIALILLSLTGAAIWWPGRAHWRRSLTIEWRARWPRITWDAHSALGVWFLLFVTMWGISGLSLSQPRWFEPLLRLDAQDRVVDRVLFALAHLHFGRFHPVTELLWALVGLVPAMLAITGIVICCRRVIWEKPSNPKHVA